MPVLDDATVRKVLRSTRYAHLSDDQFELLVAFCTHHGFDPWADHVVFATRVAPPGGGRNEIRPLITLQALRDKAESTGQHRGTIGPVWCGDDGQWRDVWTPDYPPTAAKVCVLRQGRKEPIPGVARFDECAQYQIDDSGNTVLTEFWARMPAHMVAKVAEAMALRRAFPSQLGGLYTTDEIPADPETPAEQLVPVDDNVPSTEMQFQLALVYELDLCTPNARQAAIDRMKAKFPRLYHTDRRRFWSAALAELKQEREPAASN